MWGALFIRDFRLALRSGHYWLQGLMFHGIFLSVCVFALQGHADVLVLVNIAPALIWLGFILALLLSFQAFFYADYQDGTLTLIKLEGHSFMSYVSARLSAHFVLSIIPLLISLPLWGGMFGLGAREVLLLALTLVLASPGFLVCGAFASLCMIHEKASGMVIVLLAIPLIIPLLVFAIGALSASHLGGVMELKLLAGVSGFMCVICLPVICLGLRASLE